MNSYYEILGLKPGASQVDIKKAYFQMIRQYSPESDPEQFQKIRHAYEQLKDMADVPQGPQFQPLSDSFAEKMMKQIEQYRISGSRELFRDACEEAWRLFPKDIQFLYLLVIAQRQCGNTGKAVKNAEVLVSKEPENQWFQKELAFSYMERGFTRKAYHACEKAYEMGCRDLDFVLIYAVECSTYGKYDKGVQILLEVVRQEKRWSREELPELMNAYMGLLTMNSRAEETYFSEIIQRWIQVLEKYNLYLADYIPEFVMIMRVLGTDRRLVKEDYQKLEQVFRLLKKASRGDTELESIIEETGKDLLYWRMESDSRLNSIFVLSYGAYFDSMEEDSFLRKYTLTDVQLCMIEERAEILQQEEIIKSDYPAYYEKIRDFLEKLKSEKNILILKEELQRIYQRMSPFCGGGYYYERYPEEKKKLEGTLLHDGMSSEPYVRSSKKIGRNDPCPCGSGKKYKHCCMRK